MEMSMRNLFSGDGGELYSFADFRLHVGDRRVTRGDHAVHVSRKTFDVLTVLVRRAGRLVTKRQLVESVWPDVRVETGILTVHVAMLRKMLGDCRTRPRFIETVSGYGYRFIGPVRRELADAATLGVSADSRVALDSDQ
jgi:DNA-binding winged helix-turn-helix (wHTH) protein